VENANNPKDSARRTNYDAGQNSPCATDRHKWHKQKEEDDTRSRGGKQSHTKEKSDKEEITTWFYTRTTMHPEQAPRGMTEQGRAEGIRMETQEKPMEEEMAQDTGMDTEMPEASEPSTAQRKRTWEQASGSRKKAKAHKKPMETSLTTDDVELIATTVEDRLSEVWENVENHRASILEKIQEVKTDGAVEDTGRTATEGHTRKG
jgi:hypothetical protein